MRTRSLFASLLFLPLLALAQAPASKQVEVFGQKIHYLEAGSGPTVVLLHGLGGDGANWAFTLPALAKSFHVFVPDQIGFGQSDKPLIDYRVGTLVDFLEAFFQKTGITKAVLVGNSLGGWTALDFTLAHPDQVERLVLVDSAGYSLGRLGTPPPSREVLTALNPSTVAAARTLIATIFANKSMATDANAERFLTDHLRKGDGYTIDRFIDSVMLGQDVVDGKLGGIHAPTLVIWGREDGLIPLANGTLMAKEIPGAESVILDHCGHVPQMECAAPFIAALTKFLGEAPAQTTAGRP